MRLTVLKCGFIRTWRHLLAGETDTPERIDVPVPFFVLEHREQLILFDACQVKPSEPVPEDAAYIPLMSENDTLTAQLQTHGFPPEKISAVILSHTHGDHCGGLEELKNVPCLIQKNEAETPSGAALMKAFPDRVWRIIDGRTDLYGDGRIIALPTPGHTPGHQSLLVQMDNGSRVCLAADALYMDAALDDDREMRYTSPESIRILRALRGENVRIISGHDPGSFEGHCQYFRQHPAG